MKPLLACLVACSAILALGLTDRLPNYSHVTISAEDQENDGALIWCRGNVQVATTTMLLRADEVDFNADTGELEARGNVRLKLAPGPRKSKVNRPSQESARPDLLPIEQRIPRMPPEIVHPQK